MAVREAGTRQDTFAVRLTLDGTSFGIWDKKTGGEIDSDAVMYKPGAMLPQQNLGGSRTSGNLTLQRVYDRFDDHAKINTLLGAVGRGEVVVTQNPMDEDGNEMAKGVTWHGTLKRVAVPDVDSESTTAAMIEIEVVVKGYPASL